MRRRDLLEEISGLNHLHFSVRAQRRARRRRLRRNAAIAGWVTGTLTAALFGLRAPDGLDLLGRLLGEGGAVSAEAGELARPGRSIDAGPNRGSVPVVDATPLRPTPPAPASPSPSAAPVETSISGIIYDAAAEFGLDGAYLLSVAHCESTLNPAAYNAAGYHGLFQFDFTTWNAYGYGDIYDPVAQARTAARLLAAGEASRWPNCA